MEFEEHIARISALQKQIKGEPTQEILVALLACTQFLIKDFPKKRNYCFKITKYIKEWCLKYLIQNKGIEFQDLYYKTLLFEAQNKLLDSALIYLEKNRDPEDKFYLPRRKQFIKFGLIGAMQDLLDDKIDILSISLPPGTGKTTLEEMFLALFMGWEPDLCNLFSSHSGHVTRMVYDVINEIIGVNVKKGQVSEYAWKEIFPNVKLESVNATEETINLGKFKQFKTLTCRALGASQTGVTRAEGLLCVDDICSGIEEALSKPRLDKLWTLYSTDLKTRKKQGRHNIKCKELHIATRWSVWDVIGRIQRLYEGSDRCKFISVPDIDPVTHKSNFNYDYNVGFDEKYFDDIRKSLDDVTYQCLYKNQPVEREGLLYSPTELRRYDGILPDIEPDGIWAFCDTKDTGTDYNCLGVFYQYGADFYLHDVVFKNIDPYKLDDINARCLVENNVQIAVFESNKEGSRTADKIQEKILKLGGRCSIQKKFATQNKETKIIVNSPWVLQHVIFKDTNCYDVKSDYGQFMAWLCAYSQLAKNPHDDAPDMVAMLANHMSTSIIPKVKATQNPFW